MLVVKNRDLVVDGAFLGRNESCSLEQGVQGFPVLLVGESEVTEAGQLEPLRYLIRRYMTQLGFGGGQEGVPYGSELGEVGRRSRGTGVQRP